MKDTQKSARSTTAIDEASPAEEERIAALVKKATG